MRHPHSVVSLLAAVLGAFASAGAQLSPALDASVGPARPGGGDRVPLSALSPAVRAEWSRLSLGASGDVPLSGALHGVAGRAAVAGAPAPFGRWRLAAGAAGERGARWGGLAAWRAAATTQLSYARGPAGLWLDLGASRVASVHGPQAFPTLQIVARSGAVVDTILRAPTSFVDPLAYRAATVGIGAWRSIGSWIGAVTLRSGVERVPGRPPTLVHQLVPVFHDSAGRRDSTLVDRVFGDSGEASALRHATALETRVAWMHGRVAASAAAGVRLVDPTASPSVTGPGTAALGWAMLDATWVVGRKVAVVGNAGTRPPALDVASFIAGTPTPAGGRARYASLGVRLSPSLFTRPALPLAVRPTVATFTLRPAESGRYTVRVRVPVARTVEMSGDFTGWHPVAMQRLSADVWEAVVPIAHGTHQVSIRVDGDAWKAPPGLAPVADDFDGTAGIVVVP